MPPILKKRAVEKPKVDTPERVLVGETQKARAPFSNLNSLSQTRQEITQEDIEELTQKLIRTGKDGRKHINLIQPPTIGRFTRKQLRKYLKELNDTWNSNHKLSDLTPNSEGNDEYLIVIAGHRRILAVEQAAEELEIPIELVDLEFNVEEGSEVTFHEAVMTQYRENFHKRPESWEDAHAISSIYNHGVKVGRYKTYVDCANDLGITSDRVANAYRYETVPKNVRDLVENKILSYQKAIALTELFSLLAYKECADKVSEAEKDEMLKKQRANKLYLPVVMEFIDDKKKAFLDGSFMHHAVHATELTNIKLKGYINSTIESILNQDQLMLIAVSEAQAEAEHERQQRIAARSTAIGGLRTLIAVLATDRERLKNEKDGLLSITPEINFLLHRAIHHLIENQGLFSDNHGAAIKDLEEVLGAAETAQQLDLNMTMED